MGLTKVKFISMPKQGRQTNHTKGEDMIHYKTGRIYDSEQILEIKIESESIDEYGLTDIVATFRDASRYIAGRVRTVVFNDGIGQAVLDSYDSGRYESITFTH